MNPSTPMLTPASAGPSMKLRVRTVVSRAATVASALRGTRCAISARRAEKSVVKPRPLTNTATYRCTGATTPAVITTPSAAMEVKARMCAMATIRRFEVRSTTAPMPRPNSTMGVMRSTPIKATRAGDPVRSNISQPSTASSPVRTT